MINIVRIVAPILLAISYVPQIIELYKTKNSEGISKSFWLILDGSLICFVIMAIYDNSLSLALTQGLNLLLSLIVTLQVFYYSKNKSED